MAQQLADFATEKSLSLFETDLSVQLKSDGTAVTRADVEIERHLLEVLGQQRPEDSVLGEEFGSAGSSRSNRRWILDPIDGTDHFIAGRSDWGTHIALEQDGEVVVGVVTRPALGNRWWATRGGGAHRAGADALGDSVQLRVSEVTDLAASRVSIWTSEVNPRWERLANRAIRVESDLNDILRLAAGELECVFDVTGEPWDHAPLVLLVEEAGGRFQDRQGGRRIDLGEVRYTNGRIDGQLDAVMAPQ